MKNQKLRWKLIFGLLIFLAHIVMFCGNVHAETWTYTITGGTGEYLSKYEDIYGEEDNSSGKTKRNTIVNYFYQVWNRQNNFSGYSTKSYSDDVSDDVNNFTSTTSFVNLPNKKYVIFAYDKVSANGANLYDISNYTKRKRLLEISNGSNIYTNGKIDYNKTGGEVGYAHGSYSRLMSLKNVYFWKTTNTDGTGTIEPQTPINLAYMMAFYKSNGKGENNVQRAIWNTVYNTSDTTDDANKLTNANNSFVSYETKKTLTNQKVDITKSTDLKITEDGDYYKVGPLNVNNYLYWAFTSVANYSGSKVKVYDENENTRQILGGIVKGSITLSNGTSTKEYQIKGSGTDIYIKDNGIRNHDTYYPHENASFYLYIKKDKVNDGYYQLQDITFKYRKTEAKGDAYTFTYTKKNPYLYNTEHSNDWARIIIPMANEVAKDSEGNSIYIDQATVTVTDTDYTTQLNISFLQSNVSINNYIYKVHGSTTLQERKNNALSTTSSRADYSESGKSSQPVLVEAGDKIEYIVELHNLASAGNAVYVRLEDIVPDTLENVSVAVCTLDTSVFNDTKNKDGILSETKSITSTTISENDWPSRDKEYINQNYNSHHSGYVITRNGKKYVLILGTSYVHYRITGTVKKDDGGTKVSKATIKETYLCVTQGHSDTDDIEYELGAKLANTSNKQSSSDYFICKQYNATIDTYISNVTRNDGSSTVNNEKLAASTDYYPGANRSSKDDSLKSNNSVYVENGDKVIYTIKVKNNASSASPYFSPKSITATVKLNLPTGSTKVESVNGLNISWTESTKTILVKEIESSAIRQITVVLSTNTNSDTILGKDKRKFSAEITNIKNSRGKTIENSEIVNNGTSLTSSDYYQIKEYNVAMDTYITNVKHVNSQGGASVTYNNETKRRSVINKSDGTGNKDSEKNSNPVYVEYGDTITYEVIVYNTTNDDYYNCSRDDNPYRAPQNISLSLKGALQGEISNFGVINNNNEDITKNVTINGKNIQINNVNIGAGTITKYLVTFKVEDVEKAKELVNKIEIDNDTIRNINGYKVKNNSLRLDDSDKYKLSSYSLALSEYISQYNAEMAKYNNAHGFTQGENEGFSDGTTNYNENSPLYTEKHETFVITAKVQNIADYGEKESDYGSYNQYLTRVRPTKVIQFLPDGLERRGFSAIWHKSDGTTEDITQSIKISYSGNEDGIECTYLISTQKDANAERIILSSGEYIVYNTEVRITESNEYSGLLNSRSYIDTLTNVNRNSSNNRIVTEQNVYYTDATTNGSKDYFRLKDLVIAGNVWEDTNRDGYKGTEETGKSDIKVSLYKSDVTKVAETTTNSDGFYTFGRRDKSLKYYIEFEYDGEYYKATEVYGGEKSGNSSGYKDLTEDWYQGYSDLPGTKTGSEKFMTDSNAYEFSSDRNTLNTVYNIIGFNGSYANNGALLRRLLYNKTNHESMLNQIYSSNKRIIARTFIKQNYSEKDGVAKIINNTSMIPLYDYKGYSSSKPETEYMKYINLGLVTREKVDLSLDGDVVSVETVINGEEFKYEFGENNANSSSDNYSSSSNAYKLDNAYELKLDSADYNYRYKDYYDDDTLKEYKGEESELAVKVNYKFTVRNKANTNDEPNLNNKDIPIEANIKEIAIYYDANFIKDPKTKVTVKQKDSLTGIFNNSVENCITAKYDGTDIQTKIRTSSKYKNKIPSDLSDKGYNVLYLTELDDNYLAEGDSKDIEISFFVDKDTALKLFDSKENNMGLEVIGEISAYSTKYGSSYSNKYFAGNYTGLVDSDSNPGNLGLNGIEDYNNYEDDTYKTGIKIDLKNRENPPDNPPGDPSNESRLITGFVWEDARSRNVGTISSGIQYMGNGTFNTSDVNNSNAKTNPYDSSSGQDKVISGVKVTLMEMIQKESGIYYEKPAKYTYDVKDENGNIIHRKGTEISAITDGEGKYELNNFIPGYYIVRFDYGYNKDDNNNILYNGQDYKSTTYYNNGYYTTNKRYYSDNIGSSGNYTYFDNVKSSLIAENKSDAQDDEIRRLNVNSYSETMTTAQAKVFSEPNTNNNKDVLTKNTWMYAESTIFYVKPENTNSAVTSIPYSSINGTSWELNNVDFGLEYRPEASIVLDKEIDNIELVTSDNKTLMKVYFKEELKDGVVSRVIDTSKSVGSDKVQYLSNLNKTKQGFVYINMDTDILQGATLKVQYTMDALNNSEVDRINKNLYNIKYPIEAINKGYKDYGVDVNGNYSANGTAARALSTLYYDYTDKDDDKQGTEDYNYLKKIKKPYYRSGRQGIGGIALQGTNYYGVYLGETYYTGERGMNDVIAELKVDNILDYVDNDFTFNTSDNNGLNNSWGTVKSEELKNILNWSKVKTDQSKQYLVDKNGIRYDTENRSNLVLSVDSNKNGINNTKQNESLSRFLITDNVKATSNSNTGTIKMNTSKIFSAEDLANGDGLSYENIAEIVQYTSLTGRRTSLPDENGKGSIVGNSNVEAWTGYRKIVDPVGTQKIYSEDDTDGTEIITITPPTGLTK